MVSQQKLEELKHILINSQHIRIVSHRNPDGDAIGSMIAFTAICNFFHVHYELYIVDPIPKNLVFLTEGLIFNVFNPKHFDELQNEQTDMIVFLDCGQINRAGEIAEYTLPHQIIINIDHHMSNPNFGNFNYVEDISSTCELLYHIIRKLEIPISLPIANALYVGLVTDTGMFQFDKVSSTTHLMVAYLLDIGVKQDQIHSLVYQNNPIEWIELLKKGLQNIELYCNNTVALVTFSLEDLESTDPSFDDTHILFPILLATDSVQICVILKEKKDGTISASLRSKNGTDVAKITQAFGGGGHVHAAGCRTSQYSLQEFKTHIYHEIKKNI